jgi:multiple sugar transport system ATP-binding protein
MAIVPTRGLTKVFREGQVGAVVGVDLESREGEFLVLLGPSGSGKTTLLRMIAGLEEPTSGEIWIGGGLVNDMTPRERRIAMVFQSYALYPHLTVHGNIVFPLKAQKVPAAEREKKAKWASDLLGIGHLLGRRPRELSGGERQRVAIARAIVTDPAIILADEPTGNLDSKTGKEILEIFEGLSQKGVTIVLVTHDPSVARHAHRVVHLRDGRIERIEEVRARTAPRAVVEAP